MDFDEFILRFIMFLALFALLLTLIFMGGVIGQGLGWWHFNAVLH